MLPPVIHGFHRGRSFQSSKPKFFENPCLADYGNGLILRDRRDLSRPGEPPWPLDGCEMQVGRALGKRLLCSGDAMNSSLCLWS